MADLEIIKKYYINQRFITETIKSNTVPYLDLEKSNFHHRNLSLNWPSILFAHRDIFRDVGTFVSDTPLMMRLGQNFLSDKIW
jgi:hypothetical protein